MDTPLKMQKKYTVAIVDDSKFIVDKLQRFFIEKLAFTVIGTGCDGNEAIALYEKYKPNLLTLDISMPQKRGTDAAMEILAKYPDANIMIISAVRGADILECISHGVKSYMEKPLRLDDEEFVQDFVETIYEIFPELQKETA